MGQTSGNWKSLPAERDMIRMTWSDTVPAPEQQSIDDHRIRKDMSMRAGNLYIPEEEKKSIDVYKVSNPKAKIHSGEKNALQIS